MAEIHWFHNLAGAAVEHSVSHGGGVDGMICNSFLFFDRMAEMMIIIGGVLPDMNPVDVLHCVEKFELHFESSALL